MLIVIWGILRAADTEWEAVNQGQIQHLGHNRKAQLPVASMDLLNTHKQVSSTENELYYKIILDMHESIAS